jgi:hypothetical protein
VGGIDEWLVTGSVVLKDNLLTALREMIENNKPLACHAELREAPDSHLKTDSNFFERPCADN